MFLIDLILFFLFVCFIIAIPIGIWKGIRATREAAKKAADASPRALVVPICPTARKNAAIAAMVALEGLAPGVPIDEASFRKVAAGLAEYTGPGFLVQTLADVQKLCDHGSFFIFFFNGKLTASFFLKDGQTA